MQLKVFFLQIDPTNDCRAVVQGRLDVGVGPWGRLGVGLGLWNPANAVMQEKLEETENIPLQAQDVLPLAPVSMGRDSEEPGGR